MWLLLREDFLFLFFEFGIFPGLFSQVVTTSREGEGGDKYTDTLHPTHIQSTPNTCLSCTLHMSLLHPTHTYPTATATTDTPTQTQLWYLVRMIYYLQVSYWHVLKRKNRCISIVQYSTDKYMR